MMKYNFMVYIKTLFNYDRDDEIQLCLIMIKLYIKQ